MAAPPTAALRPRPATRDVEPRAALRWAIRAFLAWFLVYLVLQGQDGYFAITVDRVESLWVKLTFLNVPLQLALSLAAIACASSARPRALRTGLALAALNGLLIAGHVALSVATAA